MKNTAVVAGIAVAFLVLAPGAALASTAPSTSATPEPGTTAKPAAPKLTITPRHGVPGAELRITAECDGEAYVTSRAVDAFATGTGSNGSVRAYVGTVRDVRAGEYPVNLRCHPRDGRPDTFVDVAFVVDRVAAKTPGAKTSGAKQVAKVPAGAPQTGGTDGPVDDSGAPLAAAAAMGVLAVGGSGLVLARRARRR
ncbi:Uncharacterised protein [Amycolatopsis camponoti]|uniref:Gram-positive cocci surface proteins LPxTG domain-containing protein n=1 Tax=Amycolatopsis camponoti TaxID=2606593 RepID=A0A6I8M9I9_9PSEU|nr:hypothetical protein [Amycolatopsis camponoti]VVJ24459.1 Uncharacterised protein [Amycolatopsis camponoti]